MSLFTKRSVITFFTKRVINSLDNSCVWNQSLRSFSRSSTAYCEKKEENSKDLVVVETVHKLRLIGINRPEKRNCINRETATALLNAFKDFDADDDAYVAVLYGKGGNFCAGYDLSELSTTSDPRALLREEQGPMGPTRYETKKPVFAAIEGYAVGGGLELALWCDFRVMEETAIMGVFNRRYGVPMIDGGTARLPLIVGLGKALDFTMTGRPIRAEEALQCGLVNIKCATGSAIGQTCKHALALVDYPQEGLRADRESVRRAYSSPSLSEALIREHRRGLQALDEAKEGATLFTQGKGRHGDIFNHIPEGFDEY